MKGRVPDLGIDYNGIFSGTKELRKPEVNLKPRFCLICKKKMSMYNTGKYCFMHQEKGIKLEDEEDATIQSIRHKKYANNAKKKKAGTA